MKRIAIATLWMTLTLTGAPGSAGADGDAQDGGSLIGTVQELDPPARTFTIGDSEFYVPPTISGLGHVKPGMIVSVEFQEVDDGFVATSIRPMD